MANEVSTVGGSSANALPASSPLPLANKACGKQWTGAQGLCHDLLEPTHQATHRATHHSPHERDTGRLLQAFQCRQSARRVTSLGGC